MDKYDSISLSEAYWWANNAKTTTKQDAENMQRLLLSRAAEVGVSSPEVMNVIKGMLNPFVEEERKMRREIMAEDMRRRGMLSQEKIIAEDDQIIQALKWTLPKFKSHKDWGGCYRILVDCCNFPVPITDFVRRMARMGIYPKDNNPRGIDYSIPPSIKRDEWCGHQFSYQAVQKGMKNDWPDTYFGWQNSDIQDRDFCDRLDIAKIFRENLLIAVNT